MSAARLAVFAMLLSCSGASAPESVRPEQQLDVHGDVVAVSSTSCAEPAASEELLEGAECDALPAELGAFRRVSCRSDVVPTGSSTQHTGMSATYASGRACVRAYALPLSDDVRSVFHEGMYGEADSRSYPEGEVRLLDGVRAWLAHHHAYYVVSRGGQEGVDDLVRAMLEVFPDVGGPVRRIPTCAVTGAVIERSIPPTPLDRLEAQAGFATHFEGNLPSGVRVSFPDDHPLALAGLRRNEIVHVVDQDRIRDRRAMTDVLERMTRLGRMDIVVSRARVRHARCIRLRIEEMAARPPDAGPPDAGRPDAGVPDAGPPPPQTGRHCVRRSNDCWDCADFQMPAQIGCTCRGRDLCVNRAGANECLTPTRVCCMAGTSCNTPPGCDGVASTCSASTPGGRNERCTFPSTCPAPLPRRAR